MNVWVTSAPSGGSATFTNYTTTSVTFTASKPGDYIVKIGVNTAGGCYKELQTTVHAGTASGNSNTGTAGWQSGVLSDNRKAPGSNIVSYGGNIYFTGRDGMIYYYNFSTALQKWVINQIPGISNTVIPAAGAFTKIGIAKIGTADYLFYTDNSGLFKKINLTNNVADNALTGNTKSNDFIVATDAIYALETGANTLISNQIPSIPLVNASLKILIPGIGVAYIQNNNLFVTGINYALTTSGDVYLSSDIVYFNGWLYYARGQKGAANLYRLQVNNPAGAEQITTSSNLSGVFTINPASGVIYYGVLNAGAINTTYTVSSGMYKSANIYQAHLSGTNWLFNPATTIKPREELDMYIQSPVYTGNHLYYIGAGHNSAVGDSYELEVWNLYYENACAPVLQRTASPNIEEESTSIVTVYPNPFSNTLQLDLSGYSDSESGAQTNVDVEIVDVTGKPVYKHTILSELSVISTSEWTPGVYLVKIKQDGIFHTQKVIKLN